MSGIAPSNGPLLHTQTRDIEDATVPSTDRVARAPAPAPTFIDRARAQGPRGSLPPFHHRLPTAAPRGAVQ